ncbi:SMI1/KNR4 family protein [Actinomadura sp. GC306]|uniref:SMI1/KNR4 family protein n=1 Tax=Actinomadura sp. GC306 TaxID=2530367 RepID=UPI00104343F3|nr:SMI1/KNR4 family protein [Actinomadura sp. GC306]TDC62695.1 SMI1/KNR4 family protein [Actinomadura sp. GC306]
MPAIDDFATWEPLLRLLREGDAESLAAPGGHVAGRIGRHGWSMRLPRRFPPPGRALQTEDMRDEKVAVQQVRSALEQTGIEDLSFVAEISPTGRTVLYLLDTGPAVESGLGPYPGSLVLVEGSVPEPWRRLPDPAPEAVPAPSADLDLLKRTLEDHFDGVPGATDAEIAAAEQRLGVALPEEIKVLYRVVGPRGLEWNADFAAAERFYEAVRCEVFPLEEVYIAHAASRPCPWRFAAMEAVSTPSDAAVQGVVGSPGWIVFGDSGGGDRIAVDLTPGPRGHAGQIIMLSHERSIGADLLADSLTEFMTDRDAHADDTRHDDELPAVARVNVRSLTNIEAAVHPRLEVLSIGVWEDDPLSLAPVIGLPRLRTLTACAGTLADPLQIAELKGLEFLELGSDEWRRLLDARAVPRSLSAAAIEVPAREPHPLPIVDLANDILALWDRPPITRTVLEGDLAPAT